jgi:uncharacterized small protein (DUF1192 family)
MFGLTKREQRWKAEQKAAETLAGLAVGILQAVASVRVAEANANAISKLQAENARLKAKIDAKDNIGA